MKQSLYTIMEEHKGLLLQLEEGEGEVTPEIESSLFLNNENFEEKAVSYGYMIKKFEDDAEIVAKEIKRLQGLKKVAESNADRLRERIDYAMTTFGIDKVEKNNLKLFYRNSEAVEILDETIIPDKYLIPQAPTIDKKAIKDAYKNQEVVPGAEIVTRKNLQIK